MEATEQSNVQSQNGLEELRVGIERHELLARIGRAEASVTQQQAIASRIETAAEVEIEEFYAIGDEAGLASQDWPVIRRIYRFKGRLPERTKPIIEIDPGED